MCIVASEVQSDWRGMWSTEYSRVPRIGTATYANPQSTIHSFQSTIHAPSKFALEVTQWGIYNVWRGHSPSTAHRPATARPPFSFPLSPCALLLFYVSSPFFRLPTRPGRTIVISSPRSDQRGRRSRPGHSTGMGRQRTFSLHRDELGWHARLLLLLFFGGRVVWMLGAGCWVLADRKTEFPTTEVRRNTAKYTR